jgi:hypothetical protein
VLSLVNDNLKRADELAAKGEMVAAQSIWNGIVDLYGSNQELQKQVKYARARLSGEKVERTLFGIPKPRAKDGAKDSP